MEVKGLTTGKGWKKLMSLMSLRNFVGGWWCSTVTHRRLTLSSVVIFIVILMLELAAMMFVRWKATKVLVGRFQYDFYLREENGETLLEKFQLSFITHCIRVQKIAIYRLMKNRILAFVRAFPLWRSIKIENSRHTLFWKLRIRGRIHEPQIISNWDQ